MRTLKLHNIFGIAIVAFILISLPLQSEAAPANKHKAVQPTKDRLVLMPLRIPEEDKDLAGAMETALVNGLQQKYVVYSGEVVSKKAHEIFMKENRNMAHTECDEVKCLQNIAMAFQAELLATANVTKKDGSYFLALSIQNIFDNKVVDSKSNTCENCKAVQVIAMLKVISGSGDNSAASEAALAEERKAKAEELKQEQLAFEEKLRKADAADRKRLLDAKAQDDKLLVELKAQAEERRKISSSQSSMDFPTVETAIKEINRLIENLSKIESDYEKKLTQIRKQISQRYADQFTAIDNMQRDEFETSEEFKEKQWRIQL